jgi:tetratricopeptide (TPR) repeat protein
MFPQQFLSHIAHKHELSPDQKEVFLMRVGDGESYENIAVALRTSPDACLKRMGQVYKKLEISGTRRGKESRLKFFLENQLEKWLIPAADKEKVTQSSHSHNLYGDVSENNISENNISENNISEHTSRNISENTSGNIYQNLPAREYTAFFGRNQEIARLMELLHHQHGAHLISVDGMGGVGKTTLVVEVAYRCLEASNGQSPIRQTGIRQTGIRQAGIRQAGIRQAGIRQSGIEAIASTPTPTPTFEAIIFTSAKQNHLTSIGLLPRLTSQRTLRDICREIAYSLDLTELTNLPLVEQFEMIRHQLSQMRTLLIVDNLETIEDKQEVLSFLYDLPPSVKIVITTREQALFVPIRLGFLPKEHGLHLIEYEAREKDIFLSIEQSHQLFDAVSGIPAAIIYAIGQIAGGYLLEDVIGHINNPEGDVARFCFSSSVNPLKQTPPHYLLMALALFVQPISRETVASVAFEEADPIATADGLAKLQQLSLAYQQHGRYSLLQLTREYALAELASKVEFSINLRHRWVNWYVKFSEAYGGTNWREWHLGYGYLEVEWENLTSVLEWCINQGRYLDVKTIWQHIKGYTHIRGYWDECLDWTDWLIEAAKQSGDWQTAAEVMSDRSRTLVNIRASNQLQEAETLLQEAWNLSQQLQSNQSITFQLDLATNIVILYIHQQKWQQAQEWLTKEEELLQEALLPELEQRQQQIHIIYYRAQIYFKIEDYQLAETLYHQALEIAQEVGWQRATAGIYNWLAEIALKQGKLQDTRQLLELSFPMAVRHKDKRSIAFHKATFAKLEEVSGNLNEAKRWAKEAAEVFESLKMLTEAKQMIWLIANC